MSWRNESKNGKKRWSSHLKHQRLGPCPGLAATVSAKAGAEPRDGRDPVASLGSRASHPDLWDQPIGGREKGINLVFGVCLFLLARGERGEQLLRAPLEARGLAPSTCSDLEKEVTGTCRQEPLTYIKKVYSRESVYISINISCIYINKYIKRKECIILMQHKVVLRERVSKYEHCNLGYTDLGKRKDVFDCLFCIFTVLF